MPHLTDYKINITFPHKILQNENIRTFILQSRKKTILLNPTASLNYKSYQPGNRTMKKMRSIIKIPLSVNAKRSFDIDSTEIKVGEMEKIGHHIINFD